MELKLPEQWGAVVAVAQELNLGGEGQYALFALAHALAVQTRLASRTPGEAVAIVLDAMMSESVMGRLPEGFNRVECGCMSCTLDVVRKAIAGMATNAGSDEPTVEQRLVLLAEATKATMDARRPHGHRGPVLGLAGDSRHLGRSARGPRRRPQRHHQLTGGHHDRRDQRDAAHA
ncbi:hypothetical protein GI374_11595 [Paracoccus sp. S-4012]|uniref:hypothetical protein n=1 Tax=Paracoccus sp. S-4012 TaxID=2665648 RepID=UPI0012AFF44E|nr:hypothetical protein [Paracoccus sp. S-4012]MRX51080.1 hypothetical protein [Paracoccus sp. S-4012]